MGKVTVKESIIFVTGANRGIGKALVQNALERGANKIYASARDIENLSDVLKLDRKRIIPVSLDVTQPEQVESAAKKAKDTQILINNAAVAKRTNFLNPPDLLDAYHEMEVNYFGALRMVRAFVPHIKKNGKGAVVNFGSIASFVSFPGFSTYSTSKAAMHSFTQGLRAELASGGIFVVGVYPGPVDTDMAKGLEFQKETPEAVAKNTLDGLEAGVEDIFPDSNAKNFMEQLKKDPKALEKQNAAMLNQPQA